jgi:hypothetical protein
MQRPHVREQLKEWGTQGKKRKVTKVAYADEQRNEHLLAKSSKILVQKDLRAQHKKTCGPDAHCLHKTHGVMGSSSSI